MTINSGANATVAAAVTKGNQTWFGKMCKVCGRATLFFPLFLYVFVGYIVIELTVSDVRLTVAQVGPYAVSWVEVIYLLSTMAAMLELLRVSKPGVDNTIEAIRMLAISIVFIVLFVWAVARGSASFAIFNNTEFMMLTLISVVQVVLAFMLNARTLKRTIDYGANE